MICNKVSKNNEKVMQKCLQNKMQYDIITMCLAEKLCTLKIE